MERIQDKRRLQNLEQLVSEAGSARALAQAAQTNPSYLSQVRRGTLTPSGKPRHVGNRLAEKLERAMGKPPGWMDQAHTSELDGAVTGPSVLGTYPLIPWQHATTWHEQAKRRLETEEYEYLPCPIRCSPATFVLQVRGESNRPRFDDGDLIFVDPKVPAEHGRFVVAQIPSSDSATFKQLLVEDGQQYLKAANPDWPRPVVEITGPASICGVVVFKGTIV